MEKTIYILLEYVSGIIAFLFLTITFIGINNYKLNGETMNMYKENWGKGPIVDIVKADGKCPKGYEKIISNDFPGNSEGCSCYFSELIGYNKKIFRKKCSKTQLNHGCTEIPAHNETMLEMWRGTNLCVKRYQDNFWKLAKHTTNDTCPTGMKKCGLFDTANNALCLKDSEDCPINYIEIVKQGQQPQQDTKNSKKIELNDGYTLLYSNEDTTSNIYVQFIANIHNVCYNPNSGTLGTNGYPINDKFGSRECKKRFSSQSSLYDSRFYTVDSDLVSTFYSDNKIDGNLKPLIGYPYPKEGTKVKLFGINYFGWEKECYNSINTKYSEDHLLEPKIEKNYDVLYVIGIISFIYVAFAIGTYAIFILVDESKQKSQMLLAINVIKVLLMFTVFILACICSTKNREILRGQKNFFKNGCSADNITTHAFNLYYKDLRRISPHLVLIAFFAILEVVMRTTYYVFFYFIQGKK